MSQIQEKERYPLNAEGPFYVENNACITCSVWETIVPDLMVYDERDGRPEHCYFKRQPQTPDEIERAIEAIYYSEIQGLRYAGNDPEILRRLIDKGCAECCDVLS